MRRSLILILLLLVLILPADPPAAAEEGPPVADVHRAVASGVAWLKQAFTDGFPTATWHESVELVVLTLSHAGVPHSEPVFTKGLETIATVPLRYTYRVSVLAMALERINSRKYQERLAHCAQWLVDTQLAGGEWGYPGGLQGPQEQPRSVTVPSPNGGGEIERRIRPETYGKAKGDFSNTQFAILGLRACRAAGIRIPKATWKAALAYMLEFQRKDGGWGYVTFGKQDEASYASLTCAGLCGVAICLHALGKDPSSHRAVRRAKVWLEENFDARRNVGIDRSTIIGPSSWDTYHLYSVERVGSVLGWKEIGGRAWYPAGARHLLATQRADGSWVDPGGDVGPGPRARYLTTADTCFAILFLARATPPLTGGR